MMQLFLEQRQRQKENSVKDASGDISETVRTNQVTAVVKDEKADDDLKKMIESKSLTIFLKAIQDNTELLLDFTDFVG
jgi:CRISPR/Cas system CSM-associated protein Csm5 (group 7 of RAMP superfamily)